MAQGDNFPIDNNGGFRTILPPNQQPGQVNSPEQANPLEEAAGEIQDDQEVTRQEDRVTLTGENQIGVRTPRPGQTEATAENANNFRVPRSGDVVEAGPAEPSPVERANDEVEAEFTARQPAPPPTAEQEFTEDEQAASVANRGAAARIENRPPEAETGNPAENRVEEAARPPSVRETVAAETRQEDRPEPEVRETSNRENIEAAAQARAAERNSANEERTETEDVQRQENANPSSVQTQVGQNVDRLV